MTWETYGQFQKHTLGFYKIFIERKFVDVLDRPTIAINICHSIAKFQCLRAKTIQNRDTGGSGNFIAKHWWGQRYVKIILHSR